MLSKATNPLVEQPLTVAINWWTDPNLFLAALVSLFKMNVWLKSPAWARVPGFDLNKPHINIDHRGREPHKLLQAQREARIPPYAKGFDLEEKDSAASQEWRTALDAISGGYTNPEVPEDAFDWWPWTGHRQGSATGLYMGELEVTSSQPIRRCIEPN